MAIAAALLSGALFGLCLGAGVPQYGAAFGRSPLHESLQGRHSFKALNTPTINAEGYMKNTEYIYEYQSQVLTGIPQASNQYAGVKVKALCVIEFLTDTHAILQLNKVSFMQVNGQITSAVMPPKWQLPDNVFRSLTLEQEKAATAALALPVKFTYNNGIIGGLEILDGDAQWSVNVKKAVLNLLQVNINIQSDVSVGRKRTFPIDSVPLTVDEATGSSAESVYRLMEDGINGKCASIYKIRCPQPGSKYLKVSKVMDYANCIDRKNYTGDALEATIWSKDVQGDSMLNPVTMTGHAEFDLMASEDRNKFIIKHATFGGQYIVNPYVKDLKDMQNYAAVYTNQTLRLLEERPSAAGNAYEALKWRTVEEPLTLHLTPDAVETLELTGQEKIEKVTTIVTAIENAARDVPLYDQHLMLFFQLMTVVKKCRVSELETLWRQYNLGQQGETQRERRALLDALIAAGSEKVNYFLLEKIENGEVQDANIVWEILTMTNANGRPTIAKIEKVSALVDKFAKYGAERKAALFALGSLTHRYIREAHVNMTVGKCDMQAVDSLKLKVAKKLQTLLSTTTCPKEMIMVLKAIGNSGVDELFLDLVKIAQDKQGYPADIRATAIYAMRRLSPNMHPKIQQALLPIFAAQQEESHVRQVACHIILKTKSVSLGTLEFIVRTLPNVDIETATLVLRKMRAIATMAPTSNPHLQRMKSNVIIALKMAKPIAMSPFVHFHRVPIFTTGVAAPKQAFLDVAYIGNAATSTPKAATVRLSAHTAGASAHLLSIRYKAHGMDKILSKILGFAASQAPLSPKQAAVNKALNDGPRVIVTVSLFGKTVSLKTLDENQILNLIQFVNAGAAPEMKVDVFKTVGLIPVSYKIPTLSGFPINLRMKAFAFADIKGHIQVQPSTAASKTILPNFSFITSKPIRLDLQLVGDLQVNAGIFKSGVMINAKITNVLDSQQTAISFDAANMALNAKFIQPNGAIAFVKLETTPSTYAVPVTREQFKHFALDKEARKEISGDLFTLKPYETSYGGQSVGAVLAIRGETPVPQYGTPQVEYAKQPLFLLGKRKLSLRLIPASPANQNYEFVLGYKKVGDVFVTPTAYHSFAGSKSLYTSPVTEQSSEELQAMWPTSNRGLTKRAARSWKKFRTQRTSSMLDSSEYATSSEQVYPRQSLKSGVSRGTQQKGWPFGLNKKQHIGGAWNVNTAYGRKANTIFRPSQTSSEQEFSVSSSESSFVSSSSSESSSESSSTSSSELDSSSESSDISLESKKIRIHKGITPFKAYRTGAKHLPAMWGRKAGHRSSFLGRSDWSTSGKENKLYSRGRFFAKRSSGKFNTGSGAYHQHYPYLKYASKTRNVFGQKIGGRTTFGAYKTSPFGFSTPSTFRDSINLKSWYTMPVAQSGAEFAEFVAAMLVHGQNTVKETSVRGMCELNPNSGKILKFLEVRAGSPQNLWKLQIAGNTQVTPLIGMTQAAGFGKTDNVNIMWGSASRPTQMASMMSETSTIAATECVQENILGCKDISGRQVVPAIKRTKVMQFGNNKVPYATRRLIQNAIGYLANVAKEFVIERTPSRSLQGAIKMTYLLKDEDKIDIFLQTPSAKYQLKNIEAPWLSRLLHWYSVVPASAGWPRLEAQNELAKMAGEQGSLLGSQPALHSLLELTRNTMGGAFSPDVSFSNEVNIQQQVNLLQKMSVSSAKACMADTVHKAIKMTVGDKTLTCITSEPLPECSDSCKQMVTRHVSQTLRCFQPESINDLIVLRHGRMMLTKTNSLPANAITQLVYDKCVVAEQCY